MFNSILHLTILCIYDKHLILKHFMFKHMYILYMYYKTGPINTIIETIKMKRDDYAKDRKQNFIRTHTNSMHEILDQT